MNHLIRATKLILGMDPDLKLPAVTKTGPDTFRVGAFTVRRRHPCKEGIRGGVQSLYEAEDGRAIGYTLSDCRYWARNKANELASRSKITLVFLDGGVAPRVVIDGATKRDVLDWLKSNQTEPCERIEWGIGAAPDPVLWMGAVNSELASR